MPAKAGTLYFLEFSKIYITIEQRKIYMKYSKEEYINIYTEYAEKSLEELQKSKLVIRDKASEMNKRIKSLRERNFNEIIKISKKEDWHKKDLLNEVLLLTYTSYIVMLEYRNDIWPYEYMTFARRIGELWEPFCKLAFEFPIKKLALITPPDFVDIQNKIKQNANTFFENLPLERKIKEELKELYEIPWKMVDSGGINMNLDLHFNQNSINYNCDFKSGFSSNEKGNTNRLLLVASIFNYLGSSQQQLLFVRQKESENNHYLQTLKNSSLWKIYCADDCYQAIKNFTDFDYREWLDNNAMWSEDISEGFRLHLQDNDLLKYLTW
jgi:hypothetical protein